MAREDFIRNIQCPTPTPSNNSLISFIQRLQKKYPNCSINLEKVERKTSNKKDDFVSIQVKDANHPIKFRLPAKKTDLSIYQTSPDYDTFNYRYDLYNTLYKDRLIGEFIKERLFLQEKFPTAVFSTKIRQKSKFSYEDKIIERMMQNKYLDESSQKTYYITDIIAGRHIISSIDGITDASVLTKLCFDFKQALIEYRKTQDGNNFNIVLQKDYISHPKPNGYQSIHLINEDYANSDCTYETQIRTLDMEEQSKTDEKIAHDTYKPRIIDQYAPLRVPIYTSITPFTDDTGKPITLTPHSEEAFYHFYGIPFSKYSTELNIVMPVINDIRNELYIKEPINPKEIG